MRQRMSIKTFLAQLPPEEVLFRDCLERVWAEFGESLGLVEVVDDAEDVKLGLLWQKRARGVSLAVFPTEIRAIQWLEPEDQTGFNGPEVQIECPEDLLSILRWLQEAPKRGEEGYP